jgi:hypothetical protein
MLNDNKIKRGVHTTLAALFLSCISLSAAYAESSNPSKKLGRLFFTPQQRTQLDYAYARNATVDGGSSPFVTVNGIVQKQGGPRTVWINGSSQASTNNAERNPTSQSVLVPGKSQAVKIKVGDKVLLDQPAEAK